MMVGMKGLLSDPTVTYCEAATGHLINRPWYAISNLAFFVAALMIYRAEKTPLARLFAGLALLVGLLSLTYDVTYVYLAQLCDLVGMLIFVTVLLILNIQRLLPGRKFIVLVFGLGILSVGLIVAFGGYAGNIIFGLYVLAVVVSEGILLRIGRHRHIRYWAVTFGVFVLGFGLWVLDTSRTVCFDFGLLNGRAIFHYVAAWVMWRMFMFYRRQRL